MYKSSVRSGEPSQFPPQTAAEEWLAASSISRRPWPPEAWPGPVWWTDLSQAHACAPSRRLIHRRGSWDGRGATVESFASHCETRW